MQTFRLLLVEDDPLLGEALQETLTAKGFYLRLARTGAEALAALSDESFDVVLQDVRLPDIDGLDLLQHLLQQQPQLQALVMTGQATIDMAVKAMKLGAFDFIAKPFSIDILLLKLERVLDYRGMERQLATLAEGSADQQPKVITRSPAMRNILDTIAVVAASEVPLLLLGEAGTGKTLLAETIHSLSQRKTGPFIRANCAAIPAQLLECELFGVEKGGLPGVERSRPGLFEAASGGTLYLEGLSDLPLIIQPLLARVLEEQHVLRVGSSTPRALDLRLICSSTVDLKRLTQQERFRKELLYRINVVTLQLPPLRERHEDIPLLASYFVEQFAATPEQRIKLSPNLMDSLLLRSWQGNVRELANLIEQLTLLYPGQRVREQQLASLTTVTPHFGTQFEKIQVGLPLREAVAEFERRYILRVLDSLGGQKTKAADVLGISRKVLWEKLKKAEAHPPMDGADGVTDS